MNSFNTISYKNRTLTVNGVAYLIQASGNNISSDSFNQIKLENNILTIDGVDITLTEYTIEIQNILDKNGNQLQDSNGYNLVYMEE